MNKKTVFIIISALLMLGLMASMLLMLMMKAHENFPKNIKVREDGVTEDVFAIRDLQLCPTESKEYEIDLFCDASGDYNITMAYEERKQGTMKHYVDVVVKANGETVYQGKLSKLIDGKEIVSFDGTLLAEHPLTVTVTYTMPYETGNEAQGTSADFDIHLKIQKI